jgi:Uma2 family endonuclease
LGDNGAMSRVPKFATYEDLLNVPEHQVAEILAGGLYTHPRPGPRHARAATALSGEIRGPHDRGRGGPGGWIILIEPELHLGSDVIVPDVAGWRRQRLPKLPDAAWFELVPDWACEVLSPSTARIDRQLKMRLYAAHGLANLWLIDPIAQTLECYRLEGGRWVLLATHGGDETAAIEPFEAVPLALSELWAD